MVENSILFTLPFERNSSCQGADGRSCFWFVTYHEIKLNGEKMNIEKIYGIYHADGGIIGELSYVWGKITGTAHCSLCDITHKGISMKGEWKLFTNGLGVDFELLHLNEQSEELADFTTGKTPCVVAKESGNLKIIVHADELEECNKSVTSFEKVLRSSLKWDK